MDRRAAVLLSLAGVIVLCGIALFVGGQWLTSFFEPAVNSRGAAVWTLLGYMGLHVVFGSVMAVWCALRMALGKIDSWRAGTMENCLLFWQFTAIAAAATWLLVAGFPYAVG